LILAISLAEQGRRITLRPRILWRELAVSFEEAMEMKQLVERLQAKLEKNRQDRIQRNRALGRWVGY
jgi:hypothetical protein